MLHYTLSGQRGQPALLFLHGFMGSAADWATVVAALDKRAENRPPSYHIITPDLPGHGASHVADPADFTIQATAQQLIALLDQEQIEQCTVVGYSMGGRVALYLATHFPQRVARLVLESSSPGLKTADERASRQRWDYAVADKLGQLPFGRFLDEWYAMGLFESFRRHPNYETVVAQRMANDPAQLALSMRHMGTGSQPSLWQQWQTLRIETLLIVGELDEKYVGISAEMATLNPNATVKILPNVGHNTHAENPHLFNSVLQTFLRK